MIRYVYKQNIQNNENVRVDLVEDQITGKICVQKSVSKNAPQLVVHQFRIEVDILSSVHHPLIPEIMNVYSDQEKLFLVESYIPGKDFSFYKKHFSLLFHLQKTKYMIEIIDILQHVHDIGYLYIDIKPANLLLYKNRVHLIDFNACIPMHSTQAVFASKENVSAELFSSVQKEESTDVYSFGKLIQTFYPFSLFLFTQKCIKQNVAKRYSSWKSMKKSFLFYIWLRRIFCVFFIILSVFFAEEAFFKTEVNNLNMYFKEPNVTTFFNAYQETLSQFQGTSVEKTQMNLYKWMERDWVNEKLWKDTLVCKYLLLQSIQSKNPILCQCVVDNIENKEEVERYLLLAKYIIDPNLKLKKENINSFLDEMEEGDLKILLPVLLSGQYVASEDQVDKMNEILIEEQQTYTCSEACVVMEYNLYLKSMESELCLQMNFFEEKYAKETEWINLYEIYRRTK